MSHDLTLQEDPLRPVPVSTVAAIELRALSKTFCQLRAVDRLTLTVEQGEIFGLLGPNGSGKTTTINLISGLSTPTSGEVLVIGYEMPRQARTIRRMLGTAPQETALYEELSAWDNLDFHADLFGVPKKEKQGRIAQMLDPRMRTIFATTRELPYGPLSDALFRQIHEPILHIAVFTLTALLLGIVFLMTTKPSLLLSLLVMGIALILGMSTSLLFWATARRRARSVSPDGHEIDPFLKQSIWTRQW